MNLRSEVARTMAKGFGIKGASFDKGDVVDFKSINKVKVLSHLWFYAKRHTVRIILVLLFVVISNVLALIAPVITGKAIGTMEGGVGNVDFDGLMKYALLLGFLYVASAVFSWLQNVCMIQTTQRVIFDIRTDVFNHIETLPMSFFDTTYKGDIISRISYDIDNISSCFSTDLVHLLTGVITVTGSLTMMIMLSPTLTLIFCIIIPITFVLPVKSPSLPVNCSVPSSTSTASSMRMLRKKSPDRKPSRHTAMRRPALKASIKSTRS